MSDIRRERSYFARIGRLKAETHGAAQAAHLELPLGERVRRSWELFERFRSRAEPAGRRSDCLAFFARARALGLYRSQE